MYKILTLLALGLAACGPSFEATGDLLETSAAGSPPIAEAGKSAEAGSDAGGLGGSAGGVVSPPAGESSGGSAGAPSAGAAGHVTSSAGAAGGSTCTPLPQEKACATRSCGTMPNGCGGEWACGSCAGGTECVSTVSYASCQVTCKSAGIACGVKGGLDCGGCAGEGESCGLESPNVCTTCRVTATGNAAAGACKYLPGGSVWATCGAPPKQGCVVAIGQTGQGLDNQWCCP